MIRIVHGSLAAVRRHPAFAPPSPSIQLEPDSAFPLPWGGARLLLARLRLLLGDAAVTDAVRPHRAFLSLVLRGLDPSLTEDERALARTSAAQPLGFLSHNGMVAAPLVTAWARTVEPLVAGQGMTIVIPNAAVMDPESMTLVRAMRRLLIDERCPRFVIGHDPAAGSTEVLWRRNFEVVQGQLALLEALPDTTVEVLTEPAQDEGMTSASEFSLDPLDDDLERRSWIALQAGDVTLVLPAMRAAFACFGFTTVLKLGLAVAERQIPLARAETAELHTLIALAAYNRQVQTAGNPELAELLEKHFVAALEAEDDPARRSHLHYRLCINSGRRKGDLETGLDFADTAIAEARTAAIAPGLAAFLEAWARNGRAYVLARQKRLADATADCEAGVALLTRAQDEPGAPRSEVAPSQVVLMDNLARLAVLAGDRERAKEWQRRLEKVDVPAAAWSGAHRWSSLLRADQDLLGAIERAQVALLEARRSLDPLVEDAFAADLGDLCYRVGDAEAAAEHYAASLVIRRRVAPKDAILRTEISLALAAARAGKGDQASLALGRAMESELAKAPAARAELLATRAVFEARQGDGTAAETSANEAIAQAVERGERDTLLRVARWVGEACLALHRPDDARAAFLQGMDIAGAADGEGEAPPPPPADLFSVLLGLRACGDARPELVLHALSLATQALGDPDAWWDLPRLLSGLVELSAHDKARLEGARDRVTEVAHLAKQRKDCERLAELLLSA
jgi:hypothetical protein